MPAANYTLRPQKRGRAGGGMLRSEAIAERLRMERAKREGTQIGYYDWAMRVPEPKAGPLNFDLFPPQKELYEEGVNEKEMVVQKATQIGMSAWAIRWALYHADTKGRTGLYVFPTKADMWDFSSLRIKPTIDGSEYLMKRQRPDDPDNKGMKGVGLGIVVFRGSESKRGLDSVDCDHIVFDEYDTLDHANIPDAEMRVSSPLSPGLIRRIGVPSFPDWGIGQMYNESDQRVWMVKCHACNEWQELDFWKNIDLKTALRVCAKCSASLEDDIAHGQWVQKMPDLGRSRGYHMSRLIFPTADMSKVIAQSRKRSPHERTVFFNKHLGLPYASEEGRLSKEAIAAAQSAGGEYTQAGSYTTTNLVTMGVDVASVRDLNVRISEHISDTEKKALYIGTCENFNDLGKLMERYSVHMACVDHLPDGRLAMAFAERYAGRVYVVSYDGQPSPRDPQVIKVNEELRHVRVRRVEAIDAMFEMIRSQKNLLPMDLPEGYVEQMQSLNRVVEEDEVGRRTIVYKKMGAADDFAHAETYDLVATEVWWMRQGLEELQRDQFNRLDDMLEFERSDLATYDTNPMGPYEDDLGDFNFGPEG